MVTEHGVQACVTRRCFRLAPPCLCIAPGSAEMCAPKTGGPCTGCLVGTNMVFGEKSVSEGAGMTFYDSTHAPLLQKATKTNQSLTIFDTLTHLQHKTQEHTHTCMYTHVYAHVHTCAHTPSPWYVFIKECTWARTHPAVMRVMEMEGLHHRLDV